MATVHLSPGVFLCLRSSPLFIVLFSVFWILRRVLGQRIDSVSSSWPILVAPWVGLLIVSLGRNYFISRAVTRHVAERGAIIPPSIQENRISVSRRLVHGFEIGCPLDIIHAWSEEYGYTYSYTSILDKSVVTMEPEHLKAILSTQHHDFPKGDDFFSMTESLLGTGIFNSDGDIWKSRRAMLRPLFNKERISDLDIFERHTSSALTQIEKRLREGYPVDVQDAAARFTIDTATEHLCGKDVGSTSAQFPYPPGSQQKISLPLDNHPSDSFLRASSEAQRQLLLRVLMGPYWPLREFFTDKLKPLRKVINEFFEPLLVDTLERKSRGTNAPNVEKDEKEFVSLLDRLVQSTNDKKSIQDGLVDILIAGRDTTASLITFAVYMMCEHPEMVSRLRSEVIAKVGARKPTSDDIRDMKYLRAFLNETLRLYPPVMSNIRTTEVATTLPNKGGAPYYIPEGSRVMFIHFLMHRRTDLWGPDALEFDPDRFLDERLGKYLTPNPSIFLPFSVGPRICMGQQFAYNEASYFLIRLLQKYLSFSLVLDAQAAKKSPPNIGPAKTAAPMGGDKIAFTPFTAILSVKDGLWVRMEESIE
ncbi:cytochrome P450 [Desarmillaria tabescens]|uniref:Cytochrome P450 n=1 Tax=Armillaria tabescens TaxID=1929756 RepID=A0AA39KFS8_ARMTA|nr:cytochrome P450 [Desarmillaria tabescens]KAK0460387.1 cytochrome P450 [Desarmillaria tabescens]